MSASQTLSAQLLALSDKAVNAVMWTGRSIELEPDDVRLLQAAAKALTDTAGAQA